jgi:hypothetical protein
MVIAKATIPLLGFEQAGATYGRLVGVVRAPDARIWYIATMYRMPKSTPWKPGTLPSTKQPTTSHRSFATFLERRDQHKG